MDTQAFTIYAQCLRQTIIQNLLSASHVVLLAGADETEYRIVYSDEISDIVMKTTIPLHDDI